MKLTWARVFAQAFADSEREMERRNRACDRAAERERKRAAASKLARRPAREKRMEAVCALCANPMNGEPERQRQWLRSQCGRVGIELKAPSSSIFHERCATKARSRIPTAGHFSRGWHGRLQMAADVWLQSDEAKELLDSGLSARALAREALMIGFIMGRGARGDADALPRRHDVAKPEDDE